MPPVPPKPPVDESEFDGATAASLGPLPPVPLDSPADPSEFDGASAASAMPIPPAPPEPRAGPVPPKPPVEVPPEPPELLKGPPPQPHWTKLSSGRAGAPNRASVVVGSGGPLFSFRNRSLISQEWSACASSRVSHYDSCRSSSMTLFGLQFGARQTSAILHATGLRRPQIALSQPGG